MNSESPYVGEAVNQPLGVSPLLAVEANAGLVLIPFVAVVLWVSLRQVLRARASASGRQDKPSASSEASG